jgi:ketosteroid isomerase-like protein
MSYMPMATALGFVGAVNAADLLILRALMTPDHVFTDALGHSYSGAETMCRGWERFFRAYPQYTITVEQTFVHDDTVALFGRASGCWMVNGHVLPQRWSVRAAWLAQITRGRVAAWSVFCDTAWVAPPESLSEKTLEDSSEMTAS